jgi:hypothetical protein
MPDRITVQLVTGRLSPSEQASIGTLAALGWKAGLIAHRLCRNPSTVSFHMASVGLRVPVERQFSYQRSGHAVRSFSPDEDALIQALRCQEYTFQAIANVCEKRFGHRRTAATICVRLRCLAARQEGTGLATD